MLTRRAACAVAVLAATLTIARAQDDLDGLQRPERLTIGTADQFLGVLAPDGRTLYFASNRNTTTELYAQRLDTGVVTQLFDEGADLSWPRVAPDGKRLLYVSFRDDAAGQLCVRPLPRGDRRCLADGSGAVQAQWLDARRILLLSRPAAQGDMRVSIVEVGRRLAARTLFDRNLTTPTVSPDGRWLVYTPVERYVERIGPGFAAKAGRELAAQRLDRPADPPATLRIDLPGLTGEAAFAADGHALYFVQFISDSNRDGVIDAGDHGVLFRVRFDPARDDAAAAIAGATPEQLTDGAWNCHYPAAGARRLIATCARGGHLDVYGLPLTGVVPPDWDAERLRLEADVTTSDSGLLLLHARLLEVERDPTRRRAELVALIRLHLRLGEFEAAEHHAEHVAALKDRATAGLGAAMRILCEHRRAINARERGRLSLDFADDSRRRLEHLAAGKASSPAGDLARRVVGSEIADVLGDKDLARRELEAAVLTGVGVPAVLQLYADRADALYRELDERAPLVAAYRALAEHPAIGGTERIDYARAAVRTATRGLGAGDAEAALGSLAAAPDSELAFATELARALLAVVDATPSAEVRDRVVGLYRAQRTPERRRAVMLEAIRRGWEHDAQALDEHLAELYVRDVPKGTAERRRAARLYRRLVEDRAYAALGEGRPADARDDFFAVARAVGSLESWSGYLDRRLHEGATVEALEAEPAVREAAGPVGRFVGAYLLARKLPKMKDDEAARASDRATALLDGAWAQLKDQPEAVAVLGAVLHERFLHTGDRASAERASAQYLIALDLARRNPRYRAMLLAQMALLQAQVGNWRIALDYFDQREKLPFVDNLNGLAHDLAKARVLLHVDREEDAAKLADRIVALVERTPRMAPFRALALDRAALYNLAADHFDRALELYERLVPLIDADRGALGARNRLVVRLARAAAALGAQRPRVALDALDGIDREMAEPGIGRALLWPHATEEQVTWTYRVIAAGLRARAWLALEQWPEAARALEARRALYDARLRRGAVDEHVRALALVETQLGEVALAQHDGAAALRHAKAALDRLDPVVKRDGDPFDRDQLVTLWLATEARLATDAKASLKLRERLGAGIAALAAADEDKTQGLMRWLEIYLGLLGDRPRPLATKARVGAR